MSMKATRAGKSILQGFFASSAEVPGSISVMMNGAVRARWLPSTHSR